MLIKKIFIFLFLIFTLSISVSATGVGNISAESAVVINADTKEILYEKDAYSKRSMASTTKIMTGILAIESGKLSCDVEVIPEALTEGTSIGLKVGYVLSLETLTYGMLLESGNDAANLCALYLGGSFENFADMMNAKAKEIGMTDTNFVTPSGLDADEHYTTAYDMSLLGAYCIENPVFRTMCSSSSKTVTYTAPEMRITFYNHNKLLDICEGVFGIKTGFTKKSGRCLVTACERNGATLICVTLNAGDDWNDHIKLYDGCFSELSENLLVSESIKTVKIFGSTKNTISVETEKSGFFSAEEKGSITEKIYLPDIIYAPVEKNDVLGKIEYYCGDKLMGTNLIYAAEVASCSEETYTEKFSLIAWIKDKLNLN